MKTVKLIVDVKAGKVNLVQSKLFLGELVEMAFEGYTPTKGHKLILTIFDEDGKTPLADNHEDNKYLDLRGKLLRKRFTTKGPQAFLAFVRELDAEGLETEIVNGVGYIPIHWAPCYYEGGDIEVITYRGPRGLEGPQGPQGPQGPVGPQAVIPDNVMLTNANETVTGIKTFTNSVAVDLPAETGAGTTKAFYVRDNVNGVSDKPTETRSARFQLSAKDGSRIAGMDVFSYGDGRRGILLSGRPVGGASVDLMKLFLQEDGGIVLKGDAFAEAGMPSSVAEASMTLPTSGQYITFANGSQQAPRSGWITVVMAVSAVAQYIELKTYEGANLMLHQKTASPASSSLIATSIPIKRGQKCLITYTATTPSVFRYIKAAAEN